MQVLCMRMEYAMLSVSELEAESKIQVKGCSYLSGQSNDNNVLVLTQNRQFQHHEEQFAGDSDKK